MVEKAGVAGMTGALVILLEAAVARSYRDRRTLRYCSCAGFSLFVYGYALNFDIRNIGLMVEDRDGSPQSPSIVSAFINFKPVCFFYWFHSCRRAGRNASRPARLTQGQPASESTSKGSRNGL